MSAYQFYLAASSGATATMISEPYIGHLVADSAAFLRNVPLHQMAQHVLTVPEVVAEIRDKATRERLQVLPYELQLRDPSDEAIRQVSEFARQTGDLRFLSATDVRVLALTLQVTQEEVGAAHLNLKPTAARPEISLYHPKTQPTAKLPVGFVSDKLTDLSVEENGDDQQVQATESGGSGDRLADAQGTEEEGGAEVVTTAESGDSQAVDDPASDPMYDARDKSLGDDGSSDEAEDVEEDAGLGDDEAEPDEGVGEEEEESDDDEDDDDGWITPANVQAAKSEMNSQAGEVQEPMKVACMTTDFTMQNILKQMKLDMVSVEGRRIREARRFVLRCFGCFQTTPNMDKQFCPWCGNKTLKRVAVTLREDGSQKIHISTRKPLSKRGTKFSLPMPRGGKYSTAPVLCGDQPLPQQRATARSQTSNAILSEDFVTGGSPFSLRDVNSRAAQLGRAGERHHTPNWERRNPNARAPPTGNKKKRRK